MTVQQERNQLCPIRKHLQERQVKSHIIYPAKLKVFGKDRIDIYEDAYEAGKAFDIKIPRSYLADQEDQEAAGWGLVEKADIQGGTTVKMRGGEECTQSGKLV